MSGHSERVQQQDTLNRYLLYFPRSKGVVPDIHSFQGDEALSKPYRYTLRFTCEDHNISVNAVLNQLAEFYLRAPNPKATWHNQSAWLPVRQINGVITSFSRLKSSGDEALYECVLEHELALLDRNLRSAVYMDTTVPGSGENPALPRFRSPDYNDHLIRERTQALSSLRRGYTLRQRYALPFLMCPTRHVMVIYYLHLYNFLCNVLCYTT